MVSRREVGALFQASVAFTVIEFSPYKLVWKLFGVKSLRLVSSREVGALFQASIAFTVIEFFPDKLVWKESLNYSEVADEVVS